jgi:hypothetical protein
MRSSTVRGTRVLVALLLLSVTFSVGRSEDDARGTSPRPDARDPFTLYPADVGALEWDAMSTAEKANTDSVMEWAETCHTRQQRDRLTAC